MYLDNAATTKVLPIVKELFETYSFDRFYNPSGLYKQGIDVAKEIAASREALAKAVHADADRLFFTSCGTESDNYALLGVKKPKSGRIIIGGAEHAAVYQCALALKQQGYDVVFCSVDESGAVSPQALQALLTPDTILVSVMHVNNETGAVNDIAQLVSLVKAYNPNILFHSDGVQAVGHIPVNLLAMGVDLYGASGHKIGAPKGVGWLYIKKGVYVSPLLVGGGQEKGMRSGTENVVGITSLAACTKAYYAANEILIEQGAKLRQTVERFVATHECCKLISPTCGAPHIVSMAFGTVRGEVMMHALEKYGIVTGIGSACSSKKGAARIPAALGLSGGYEMGMLRFSINPFDTYDWDFLAQCMHTEYLALRKYLRG